MTNQEFIDQVAVYVKKYAAIFGICVHSPIIVLYGFADPCASFLRKL